MPLFRHQVTIERDIESVFAAVADVGSHAKWREGLLGAEPASGTPGLGGRGVEVRRMFGRTAKFPYEITHFEPPEVWGFRAVGGPIRPSAVLYFESAPLGTMVTSDLTVPGPAGWLLGPIMLRQQRRNYRTLKTLLEAGKI